MSKILEIPDSVYEALADVAAANGQSPADWIASKVPMKPIVAPRDGSPRTLADRLAGRIGKFKSSGDGEGSRNCRNIYIDGLVEKRDKGHI